MGIPGVAVTAPGFDEQARAVGMDEGVPSVQVAVYPGPFALHSDAELQENSRTIVAPRIIEALTRPIPETDAIVERTRDVVFTGSLDAVNRYFADLKWSDGLAIIPPTAERIQEFLKYTGYAPHETIAVLPAANLRATPWNIAANAVMAGCRPEHMPILIAAVKAMGNPSFRLSMSGGSTHSFVHFYLVNGPLARQLEIDHGQGLIAHPTNQVIGRALGLIERNIAGFRIKETQMGTFGKPQSWVLAEDEAALARIDWNPFHVEKGFSRDANTVAAANSTIWGQNLIPATSDPEKVMQLMAYGATRGEMFASGMIDSRKYLLVTPGVAEVLAAGGYTTKGSLIEDLRRNAQADHVRMGLLEGLRLVRPGAGLLRPGTRPVSEGARRREGEIAAVVSSIPRMGRHRDDPVRHARTTPGHRLRGSEPEQGADPGRRHGDGDRGDSAAGELGRAHEESGIPAAW